MAALVTTVLAGMPGRFEVDAGMQQQAAAAQSGEFVRVPQDYNVYIETRMPGGSSVFQLAPPEIDWSGITVGLGETGSKANLVVRGLDSARLTSGGKLGERHLKHLLETVNPNSLVLIARTRGAGQLFVLFAGYVLTGSAIWDPATQQLRWTAVSAGDEMLQTRQNAQIVGRIMRKYPFRDPGEFSNETNFDLIEVDVLPPAFNAGGVPNMLAQRLLIPHTAGMRVFCGDGQHDARHWHYGNALRYVAKFYASYAGIDVGPFLADTDDLVELPAGGTSTDPFQRAMLQRVDDVSIASMSAFDALVALCRKAGLHFEVSRRMGNTGNTGPFYLRVVAPIADAIDDRGTRARAMVAPQSRDIPRDPPFSPYGAMPPADIALRNAAQSVNLSADNRVVNTPVVIGGASDYEVTLLLRPGWKPFPQLDLDLTGMNQGQRDEAARAALDFWLEQFGDEDEAREESGSPTSRYHTQHEDHHSVADIGRRWIFPDTGEYMRTNDLLASDYRRRFGPWNEHSHYSPYGDDEEQRTLVYTEFGLGGGLPREIVEKWVLRRRPFGNMLSRANLQAADLAPRMEINYTDTFIGQAMAYGNPNWIPFTGSVLIDPDRAALWIKEDNLLLSPKLNFSGNELREFHYLEALIGLDESQNYAGPRLFVRITCTVRSDQRIMVRQTQTLNVLVRERSRIIDLGYDRFRHTDRVEGNSVFIDLPESDPNYQDRDDRERLAEFARAAQARLDRISVGGDWETNTIETGVRLGDTFRGSAGMGIAFATWPMVSTIEWIKDENAGYRTKFHLDDLRHAPEVGAEL